MINGKDMIMTDTQAWNYAVGMIKVDGLEPTPEFKEYIEKEKKGEITMADVKQYLDKRYKVNNLLPSDSHLTITGKECQ